MCQSSDSIHLQKRVRNWIPTFDCICPKNSGHRIDHKLFHILNNMLPTIFAYPPSSRNHRNMVRTSDLYEMLHQKIHVHKRTHCKFLFGTKLYDDRSYITIGIKGWTKYGCNNCHKRDLYRKLACKHI